jgi:DnaJ-class molecular chaperone
MNKNPYVILELNNKCDITKEDIKKAYKRLILKYHPDKNINCDQKNILILNDKFNEVQIAYEMLIDDEKRAKYDNMNYFEKIEYDDNLKILITKKFPQITDFLKSFIKIFYSNNEDDLKKDLEEFNFNSIFSNIIDNMPNFINIKNIKKSKDIFGRIYGKLSDRYNNKYQSLIIKRDTKEQINIFVPLILDEYILENEGEQDLDSDLEQDGDIIIEINVSDQYQNFTKIENDLYVEYEMPIYNYLYGGIIKFINIDDKEFIYEHGSLLVNNIIKISEKGFIKIEEIRGDMFIVCKIHNLELIKDKIKNI